MREAVWFFSERSRFSRRRCQGNRTPERTRDSRSGQVRCCDRPDHKKILELSEESITEVVRDTFTRETDRLRLERVTIARTRADKGRCSPAKTRWGTPASHSAARVQRRRADRTRSGRFFTEAGLDASNSAIILDDPVSSLTIFECSRSSAPRELCGDPPSRRVHPRRLFVLDLKREANGKGVPIAERSVMRSRADERKPGACSTAHPWKAKHVPARLDELRRDLSSN